jgi:hypothetical protein
MMLSEEDRLRLQPAADAAGYSLADLEANLSAGHAMLWHAGEMTITSEVDEDGVCDIRLGGGKMTIQALRELEHAVVTSPFHIGANKLRLWGRKGWLRLLPHWTCCGYEDGLVILELKK